ncbi:MAG: thiamine pyrophosphate-binding protein [Anaerolineae bacterium]|nr:thiamine pyrophosphate-binding protein [Anaerolineae bacterium]MCB9132753.1 thiamine pyrophosphate-binding protein [Anaerolineales bacterium]MCB9143459.1 thiamine pyrophosphate-binding protein [Anaerolineales bacterium]
MPEITVGELLAKSLAAEGVDLVVGIIDGAHIPFVVPLAGYGIRYVNAHHEEAAVHIAEGYTRIARKPAVALGNPGPGGANMLAGLTSAYGEGHPVVAIACTRRSAVNNPDRGGAWQATDLVAMAKPITKYSALISRPERVPEMVRAALRAATSGRPGPAFLAIPDELLAQRIDPDRLRITPATNNRVLNLGAGDPALIEQAADLLANAKRPFIYAGKGVLWAGGSPELVALGDHLAAGMGSSLGARGVVPEDHPHYFHIFDMQASMLARNEADVVLVVGARLGEYDGWGMPPAWGDPARQTTIQIDADPVSIGLNRPVDVAIIADARAALAALLDAVQEKTAARESMVDLARYRELSAATLQGGMAYMQASSGSGVNPGQLVFMASQFFARDAITVLDGGNTVLWGVAFNPILEPDSFLYSVMMGYLGTGLPFAIGAKLAAPGRPVVCITGDGALGFNVMELETALRANTPLVVIVAVDDAWGMEKTAFNVAGLGPQHYVDIDIRPGVRYDLLAQALGCHGEKVDELEDLLPALQRAVESGKPAVIHVVVDPVVNADPIGFKEFRYARSL